ncbi:hypothetical protein [Bradyrhizobium sp. SZCCHNRI1003]|uniref:hypothetical protein n=1 Tax=Bradyrhizobium sp. SZCCHNRI1003 TaxID=3057275 RepID=UPI0029162D55|nr:hypothetical protein [Bradyrhizobium sp. SZCCHNRI1003]
MNSICYRVHRCAYPTGAPSRGAFEDTAAKDSSRHDLRQTAASLAGELGFDDAWIAKCLDYAASKKLEQTMPAGID